MRHLRWIAILASSAQAFAVGIGSAMAQSTPSFFPERYVACRTTPRPRVVPPSPPGAAALVPLPRRRAPPVLFVAPRVVIDVAVAEPIPARARGTEAPEPPPIVVASEDQDWRCVGFTRGKRGILAVLQAPHGARFAHVQDGASWRLANARAASAAGFTEAIPALRRLLARPIPTESPASFYALDTGYNATRALSTLGDAAMAPVVAERLASREDADASTVWVQWVPALAELDARAAEAYAADVVDRVVGGRSATHAYAPSNDTVLRATLPLLRTPDPTRLALVTRLPGSDARCDVLAARVRLGDRALREALRPELDRDLRTQRSVSCYSTLMPVVFPGEDPLEVDALLHRHRLEAILDLLERSAGHAGDARWAAARARIRLTLQERSLDPDVATNRGDRRFQPEKRVRHLVALGVLGDAGARTRVEQIIRDPAEDGVAPFLAAALALRFAWPGAADLAAHRLLRARVDWTRRHDTELDPARGFVQVNDHVVVVDALAARGDPRFALGLLDLDRNVREATALHLARLRPAAACDVVTSAAGDAQEKAVQDAFWALSLLGDACREQAFRLASTASAPHHVRGMALELLAMMRDARARPLLQPRRGDDIRPARERARIIFHARD